MSHPLVARLSDPDPTIRRAACIAAPDDPSATLLAAALCVALGDPERAVARAACDALTRIARGDRHVDDEIRRALRSDIPDRRFGAACTLARLSPPGPSLVPALVEALGHRFGDVRWTAARLLVDTGRIHGEILGILIGLLRAGDRPWVRRMAAFALRELSPDHPACADALVFASRDEDPNVKRAALTALASLVDPPDTVSQRLLEALLQDDDPASRRIATVALGELGRAHPEWLPTSARTHLESLAESSPDPDLRRGAARALRRLDPSHPTEGAPA